MRKLHFLFALILICFSAFSQGPTISSFSPASGPVGTLVTITGTNLSSPTAFTIGGVSAIVVSDVDSVLVGMVMPGAVTGAVSVTTSGGTDTGGTFIVTPTLYPDTQQGPKLVGMGAIHMPNAYGGYGTGQGTSVSLSADGNTAIVGGPYDNIWVGAAWIYTRSGGSWTQQGSKLIGTGCVDSIIDQGWSVSLSADGNTAIVGGYQDNNGTGAVWVYTRSSGAWTQQGPKLVGTGAAGRPNQGSSIALSADGNTAIVGGWNDSIPTRGAVWIFTRSGSIWSQQGPKLVGTRAINGNGGNQGAHQGFSVALSADGNTAIAGGWNDSSSRGAAWIYTRSDTTWTQQGSKLTDTAAINAQQGWSVALSADGNTALVGGPSYGNTGAAWVYIRSAGIWTQQGSKLMGTGVAGGVQGVSAALSADGNTAIVGGYNDNNGIGAAWIYTRSGSIWSQRDNKLIGTGAVGFAFQGASVSLSADGSTAIVGGPYDSIALGAAWVYSTSCSPNSSTSYDTISFSALPYAWNGLTFIRSGTQTALFTGSTGCDSAATLNLLVYWPAGLGHLYPNPNKGSFTLETSGSIGSDYTISDMLGDVIMQQSVRSDKQLIELPEAAEGVYTLVVKGASPMRFVIVR